MKGTYQYHIEQRDVDFLGKVTYVAMANYILQSAGDDADRNGFGIKDLNAGNCSWVLSRLAIEFYRRPNQGETITVRTWVNDIGRMMTTRNMQVTDAEGVLIACAVTQWAVIDIDKRIALDIRSNVDYSAAVSQEDCPVDKPRRITHVARHEVSYHTARYSDIDFNKHVNAMKYIEWMQDMLPLDYISSRKMSRLDVNFLHEARYGQRLEIIMEDAPQVSVFEVCDDGGLALCKASFTWGNGK